VGAFIVLNAAGKAYLRRFLARGGGLCPQCQKDAAAQGIEVQP
jgi:hypothetical protein